MEDKINRFLRQIKSTGLINERTYKELFASGSRPGVLYGLPKIHKINTPIRPILSTIGTHNYNLAKFIIPFIDKWSHNQFTVKNSLDFVNFIWDTNGSNNLVMASFDITSLFTNLPIIETINIILNLTFNDNRYFHGFTKEQFTKLLNLTLLDLYFIFNKQLYKQIDGLSMGSPIAPVLANLFYATMKKSGFRTLQMI